MVKTGGFTGLNVELLPVDDGARRIGDRQGLAGGVELGATGGNLRTGRVGLDQQVATASAARVGLKAKLGRADSAVWRVMTRLSGILA